MNRTTTGLLCVATAGVLALYGAGCDDDVNPQTPPDYTGHGGQGNGSNGGGGAGGQGGATGGGGSGGQGQGGCLDPSIHASAFTLDETSLCVVAAYDIPLHLGFDFTTFVSIVPSWGRQDGPLTMVQTYDAGTPIDEITLTRWQAPSGSSGPLAASDTVGPLTLGTSDPNPYLNPAAVDLPLLGWTAVGWASFGGTAGQLLLLSGATVDQVWPVEGMFAVTGVSAGGDRLVLSALSPLDAPGAGAAGLYYADVCAGPVLCGGAAATTGGDASGVISTDAAGNLFATFPDIGGGSQTVYGYHPSEIAPGVDAQGAGTQVLSTSGSGTALAALAPSADDDGYLLLQPFDGVNFVNLDVVVQRYSASADAVSAVGSATTALTMTTPGTEVTLMADDADQVWVGVADGDGSSTFYVVARTP